MKFQHFTFPVGGDQCDAKCPFCVSRMTQGSCKTGQYDNITNPPKPDWDTFETACQIASSSPELITALLTGVAEPLLYPELITQSLIVLDKRFPIVELQTNGLRIARQKEKMTLYLKEWKEMGLKVIALSIVSLDLKENETIYGSPHYDILKMVKFLHELGFKVRVCCMMMKGYVDSFERISNLAKLANWNKIDQLTIRPIEVPPKEDCKNLNTYNWVQQRTIPKKDMKKIKKKLDQFCSTELVLDYGAIVYGFPIFDDDKCIIRDRQNLCLSNCLTKPKTPDQIRNLIFFPDGRIQYSWYSKAARIL